jgi:hypothetical protein
VLLVKNTNNGTPTTAGGHDNNGGTSNGVGGRDVPKSKFVRHREQKISGFLRVDRPIADIVFSVRHVVYVQREPYFFRVIKYTCVQCSVRWQVENTCYTIVRYAVLAGIISTEANTDIFKQPAAEFIGGPEVNLVLRSLSARNPSTFAVKITGIAFQILCLIMAV